MERYMDWVIEIYKDLFIIIGRWSARLKFTDRYLLWWKYTKTFIDISIDKYIDRWINSQIERSKEWWINRSIDW